MAVPPMALLAGAARESAPLPMIDIKVRWPGAVVFMRVL